MKMSVSNKMTDFYRDIGLKNKIAFRNLHILIALGQRLKEIDAF